MGRERANDDTAYHALSDSDAREGGRENAPLPFASNVRSFCMIGATHQLTVFVRALDLGMHRVLSFSARESKRCHAVLSYSVRAQESIAFTGTHDFTGAPLHLRLQRDGGRCCLCLLRNVYIYMFVERDTDDTIYHSLSLPYANEGGRERAPLPLVSNARSFV